VATVGSRDGSFVLGDLSVAGGSEGGDTSEGLLADGANGSLGSLVDVLSD